MRRLKGNEISTLIRDRVAYPVADVLNKLIGWASPHDGVAHRTKGRVDTSSVFVERAVFDAVEAVMAETHGMFPSFPSTVSTGWPQGVQFTTQATATITAPPGVWSQP